MQLTTFFHAAAIFTLLFSPVFSLTAESTKIISGIENVIEHAHIVDTNLKNFDGGIKNAIFTATALFYSQKASNELQRNLKGNADMLPEEDIPQFLAALDGLHTAVVNATKTAASQAPLIRSTGFRSYAENTLHFYTSENRAYAKAIMPKTPESFQQDIDALVERNAVELESALALFQKKTRR